MKQITVFLIGVLVGIFLSQMYTLFLKSSESFAVVDGIVCSIDSRSPSCEAHYLRQGLERGPDGNWRVPPIGGGGNWGNNNGVGWGGPMF